MEVVKHVEDIPHVLHQHVTLMENVQDVVHMELVQYVQDIHNSHAVHLTQVVQFVHQIILVHIAMDMGHVPYVVYIISAHIATDTLMELMQVADVQATIHLAAVVLIIIN
jgi:hypothetical protein